MTILIADQPGTNTYLTSLIESYTSAGLTVICGLHNFFYSNLKPEILHIQWPEKLYSWYPFSTLKDDEKYRKIRERLEWYRENNVVIIHTIHNLKPHVPENFLFEERIFRLIIKYSDLLIHHCKLSVSLINSLYLEANAKTNIVCPHGDYLNDYKPIDKNEARLRLGIPEDKFVILNFGNQIKYKNQSFIESVFNQLPIKEKYLLTAGNNRADGYLKISQLYNSVKCNIKMRTRFRNRKYYYKVVSPADLPFYINSADIFFLAHSGDNLNSGILPLAATYSKPVVFPQIGCFEEQMNGWIFETYPQGNEDYAVKALLAIYVKLKNLSFTDNSGWLRKNSWDIHVKNILMAVKQMERVSNVNK